MRGVVRWLNSLITTVCLTSLAGILMRRLMSDPTLDGLSHVVLDEVHERSIEIDLLLLLLRDVMRRRAATDKPLRLILMSATADAELFVKYMGSKNMVSCFRKVLWQLFHATRSSAHTIPFHSHLVFNLNLNHNYFVFYMSNQNIDV